MHHRQDYDTHEKSDQTYGSDEKFSRPMLFQGTIWELFFEVMTLWKL